MKSLRAVAKQRPSVLDVKRARRNSQEARTGELKRIGRHTENLGARARKSLEKQLWNQNESGKTSRRPGKSLEKQPGGQDRRIQNG